MELILATHKLADPGGAQTYAITVAEHLARLGHSVTLYTRELGAMAELARERALRVTATAEELPDRADGVIAGVDRSLAVELAQRYPTAARVFVVHGSEDIHLPPPIAGVVQATVALNDIHLARAAACEGAGEVVRLRQPVDLRRFSPRGEPRARPAKALLLGNYHASTMGRAARLQRAWSGAGLQWRLAGGERHTLEVAEAIAEADLVVGYGRSALEAMACGRPVYVYDHSGAEGWITPESYAQIEGGGFAVAAAKAPPDEDGLRADLEAYRAEWGSLCQDMARAHHDARDHAARLVALIERVGPGKAPAERSAMRALGQLAEAQLRAELIAEHYRVESKQWFALYQGLQETLAAERGASQQAQERLAEFKRTRRYRLARWLSLPIDALRRARGRR